jgi:serine phosphatase RsbU (regulator of sigma subunit)
MISLGGTAAEFSGALARRLPAGWMIVVWGAVWATIGGLVGLLLALTADVETGPALRMSVPFALVVGFTALVAARLIFPAFARLPFALRVILQLLTLLSGTVFGSVAVVASNPFFFLNRYDVVALIVLINSLLAIIVAAAVDTYDAMRSQIERTVNELREREKLVREVEIARDVQQQLLPSVTPQINNLELAGTCVPAIGVGGDFFDFVKIDDDHVGLVCADVSGKGIPAALLMAGLQASVRSLTQPSADPAELNARLNDILYRSSSAARYATLFLGFFDGATRTLRYSNAGHHPPLVIGVKDFELPAVGGLPIGLFEGSRYEEATHQLAPGELIALFTDGVIEAPNPQGQEFGEERLTALLRQLMDRPLQSIVQQVLDELTTWTAGAPAHDDITLVLARVT